MKAKPLACTRGERKRESRTGHERKGIGGARRVHRAGDIGTPIAATIQASGRPLTLWNRTASKLAPFVAAGAQEARSAADLAEQCDILVTCIDSASGVEEILFGDASVTSATSLPRLLVDHSTLHPDHAVHLA